MKIHYQSFVDEASASGYWAKLNAFLNANASEGTEVIMHGVTPHESYAHGLVEYRCGREAIAAAITADRQGFDGYLLGHFQDTGLYEARASASIPVTGLGEASMLYGCQYGQKIGIISINPRFIPVHTHQVRKYGFQDRVAFVHAMDFQPGEILRSFEDQECFDNVIAQFEAQAEPLVRAGVDVLIPAGGIPMLLFSQIKGFNVANAPVLNGLPIALRMLETAIEMQRNFGLGVSRTRDFIQPPSHVLDEFLEYPKLG